MTFTFSGQQAETIRDLHRRSGVSTERLMIARALALFDLCMEMQEAGSQIVYRHPDGGEQTLNPRSLIGPESPDFQTPCLENLHQSPPTNS